jgi:phage-related protein
MDYINIPIKDFKELIYTLKIDMNEAHRRRCFGCNCTCRFDLIEKYQKLIKKTKKENIKQTVIKCQSAGLMGGI